MCNVFLQSLNKTKPCCYRCSVSMWHRNIQAPRDHWAHARSSTDLVWKNLALHSKCLNESLQTHASLRHSQCRKKNHSFTTHTRLISKQGIPAAIVFIPFSLFNRMKQKILFNRSFMQSLAITRSACACLSCSVLQHPRLSSTTVDNWHWRRQCVGGCVGEDDYQMSLCVEKKKNPSC